MTGSYDLAIVGGGIIGVSAAAFAAQAGLRVVVFERAQIAAGASGRNQGALQHPFDPVLAPLYRRTMALYHEVASGSGFALRATAAGLLLLSDDTAAITAAAQDIAGHSPELAPVLLSAAELHALEPAVARDLVACRLETGFPVEPAAATGAFAARARAAGATIEIGDAAQPIVDGDRVAGVRLGRGGVVAAGQVLVAAGPWTPGLVPGWGQRPPIRPLWGVVATVPADIRTNAVLEELGIDKDGPKPDELFSMVTTGSGTSVGAVFLDHEPVAHERVAGLLERGRRYVPALRDAQPIGVRACARPASFDGRPLIGAVPGVSGLFVCAGHGPWGISTGPASAELVVAEMLGHESVPAGLRAARF